MFILGQMKTPNAKPAKANSKLTRMNSAGSDTDTIFNKNSNMIKKNAGYANDRVELFSTDSEMDSFFKENETIVNKNSKYNNNDLFSSSTSPNKTDENTMNEDLEDDEFDRIVSEAQR